jgi:hypothetical protein
VGRKGLEGRRRRMRRRRRRRRNRKGLYIPKRRYRTDIPNLSGT